MTVVQILAVVVPTHIPPTTSLGSAVLLAIRQAIWQVIPLYVQLYALRQRLDRSAGGTHAAGVATDQGINAERRCIVSHMYNNIPRSLSRRMAASFTPVVDASVEPAISSDRLQLPCCSRLQNKAEETRCDSV